MNTPDVKLKNTSLILKELWKQKTSTVKDIARTTGLTPATVGGIIYQLVREGSVSCDETLPSRGGRPSQSYALNAGYAHILVIALYVSGGKNLIHAQVMDLYGTNVHKECDVHDLIDVPVLEEVIDRCLEKFPNIAVLAVSIPGSEHRGLVTACDYPAFEGVDLIKVLTDRYHIMVLLENDANIASLGACIALHRIPSVLVGIYFPHYYFYPGSGIVIDTKIFKGSRGFGGEISYIPLGCDWTALDYSDTPLVARHVAQMVAVVCGTVNPETVVLYGDFFSLECRTAIQQELERILRARLMPGLLYKDRIEDDMMRGLFQCGLTAYQERFWNNGSQLDSENINQIPR